MPANFAPTSLDHVALWVDEREPLATFLCDHLGMHVIEESDDFTLVGIDAKLGKLTLFDAEGPRQRGGGAPVRRGAGRAGEARGARRVDAALERSHLAPPRFRQVPRGMPRRR